MATIITQQSQKMADPSLEFIDLHSVDMTQSRENITKQIMEQMYTLGFLLLSNIPEYDEEALFEH